MTAIFSSSSEKLVSRSRNPTGTLRRNDYDAPLRHHLVRRSHRTIPPSFIHLFTRYHTSITRGVWVHKMNILGFNLGHDNIVPFARIVEALYIADDRYVLVEKYPSLI